MILEASELMPNLGRDGILATARPSDPLSRLSEFSALYPGAMNVLRVGGVHPTEDVAMNNPYTGKPHVESFTNVGEHCLAVASAANVLAQGLAIEGAISNSDVDTVTARALIHDSNKRLEVMRRNAVKEGVIEDAYSPKAYETVKPILEARGASADLINYLAKAGAETGHNSLRDFIQLEDGYPDLVIGRMVDKIIHLADDLTSTTIPQSGERALTVYLTTWERMIASEFPTRYPFLWKEGLAFDQDGNVVTVPDITTPAPGLRYVYPYALWQVSVSDAISDEIQALIEPSSLQNPNYFVKDFVNNALAKA